jgi:alpha-ketoglutarate-dependent taurine dioxygenase
MAFARHRFTPIDQESLAMPINVTPSGQACGATVTNVDLSQSLSAATIAEIRAAWLAHQVIAFPDQSLNDDDLERFSQYFGDFGEDHGTQTGAFKKHPLRQPACMGSPFHLWAAIPCMPTNI